MRIFLLCLLLLFPSLAAAQDRYIGVIMGTVHFGNDNLNNFNPGLTFGTRWETRPGLEFHIEGGAFYNSYEEFSPLIMAGVSTDLFSLGNVDIRAGLSGGLGYYPTLAPQLKEDYGIPNINGVIPLAAASLIARIGDTDIRFSLVPPDRETKAVINLSIAQKF